MNVWNMLQEVCLIEELRSKRGKKRKSGKTELNAQLHGLVSVAFAGAHC